MSGHPSLRTLASAVPLAAVVAFVIVPVIAVIAAGVGPEALDTLTAPSTWRIVGYTAGQALISTAISVVLALPAAYALYRLNVRGRRTLLAIITVPFVLPTVVVGLAFRELLPFPGTTAAIVVAHVFFNVGLVVRVVGSLWGHLDPRLVDVATTLGLTPVRTFTSVTWPLLRPAILGAAALVFLFTFTSFGVVLVLGDPALPTIEVAVYTATVQRLDFAAAAGLALLQFAIVAAVVMLSGRWQARSATRQRLRDDEWRRPARGVVDRIGIAWTWVLALAICIPLGALLARSLRVGDGWGLTWYAEAFAPSDSTTRTASAAESIMLSVQYAAAATVIAAVMGALACAGILAARRSGPWIDGALGRLGRHHRLRPSARLVARAGRHARLVDPRPRGSGHGGDAHRHPRRTPPVALHRSAHAPRGRHPRRPAPARLVGHRRSGHDAGLRRRERTGRGRRPGRVRSDGVSRQTGYADGARADRAPARPAR